MLRSFIMREELERLLGEDIEDVMERQRTTFDALAGSKSSSIILFGAGGLGRRTLDGLRYHGVEPKAFVDRNPAIWGTQIEGIPVLSPADASEQYGKSATFVVSIWGGLGTDRMGDRIEYLKSLGCETVLSFAPLYWKYPERLLPHYGADLPHHVLEQRAAVLEAFDLWADDASREEYLSQIRWRLHMDFANLADPVHHAIYFPKDLCSLKADETFVDCGAYNGDTIELFLQESEGQFDEIVGFEPDPKNFEDLTAFVATCPSNSRIKLYNAATGAEEGTVRISADGLPSSKIGTGSIEVPALVLDTTISKVTYLKMDIEGSEIETLTGAEGIIRDMQPVLAICCYHRQDDLWKIPLLIHAINPNYRFYLRPHFQEMWDLVCYAIPPARLDTTSIAS